MVLVGLTVLSSVAGCSQNVAEERAEQFLTRVQDAQTSQADPRALSTLRFLESDLKRPVELRGLTDEDGDRRDDDGRVEVLAADHAACVTLPSNADSGEVVPGSC